MAQDPRLNSLMDYAMTEIGVGPKDELALVKQQLADQRRLIDAILRTPNVQTGSGAPSAAARDGTLYVDTTNSRLYARSAGVWKSALLS